MMTYFVRTLLLTALVVGLCAGSAGCQFGTSPVWSTANPTKEFEMGYDPWSNTYKAKYRDNAGGKLKAKEIYAKTGDKEFRATNVEIADESVNNRDANVDQMKAGTAMTEAAFKGASELASSIGKAVAVGTESIRRPPEAAIAKEEAQLVSERSLFVLTILGSVLVLVFVWRKVFPPK